MAAKTPAQPRATCKPMLAANSSECPNSSQSCEAILQRFCRAIASDDDAAVLVPLKAKPYGWPQVRPALTGTLRGSEEWLARRWEDVLGTAFGWKILTAATNPCSNS